MTSIIHPSAGEKQGVTLEELQPMTLRALTYAANGYYVFPVFNKIPLTQRGFKDASVDTACIITWFEENPKADIGIACGMSRIGVIDVDIKNGAQGEASLAELQANGFTLPATVVTKTRSGGRHLAYYDPQGVCPSVASKLADGIDTRGVGGLVVAAGSTGYDFVQGSLLDTRPEDLPELPSWVPWKIALNRSERKAQERQASGGDNPESGRKLRAGEGRNADLVKRAGMLKRAGLTGDDLEAAVLALNESCYDPPMDEARVRNTVLKSAHSWQEDEWVPGESDPPTSPHGIFSGGMDWEAIMLGPDIPTDWIIDGLVEKGWSGTIFGDGNLGKTFIVNEMMACLALGLPFYGHDVKQPRHCGVISLEMKDGTFQRRMRPLHQQRFFETPAADFAKALMERVWCLNAEQLRGRGAIDLLKHADWLERVIRDRGLEFLVLDTLSGMHSAEENSNTEMAKVMNVVRRLSDDTNCSIAVITHTPKGNASIQRGASAIRNNLQWSLGLEAYSNEKDRPPRVMTLKNGKGNHSAWQPPIYLVRGEEGILHNVTKEEADRMRSEGCPGAEYNKPDVDDVMRGLQDYWNQGNVPSIKTANNLIPGWEDWRDALVAGGFCRLIAAKDARAHAGNIGPRQSGEVIVWSKFPGPYQPR